VHLRILMTIEVSVSNRGCAFERTVYRREVTLSVPPKWD
jgi:hypothetical protein